MTSCTSPMAVDAAPPWVVSADWLYAQLQTDRPLVVVDCRFSLAHPAQGQQQYTMGHIPGAYYLDLNRDLSSPVQVHGGRHPLPDLAQLATKLATIGVTSAQAGEPTLVVAYDDSRLAFAARLWWLLRYLGHDAVAVLDGGLAGWQAAGYPITSEVPPPRAGTFIPQVRPALRVDIDTVRSRKDLPGVVLVDAREPERYRGEREPIDPIAGSIPGAVNYPWQDTTDDRGYIKSLDAHRQRWAALAEAEEIMVYCGSGVTACVDLLSLALAGKPESKLYVGSWSDWCSYL
ncbi:sulfurtransferase [Trichothermofontia sp.]